MYEIDLGPFISYLQTHFKWGELDPHSVLEQNNDQPFFPKIIYKSKESHSQTFLVQTRIMTEAENGSPVQHIITENTLENLRRHIMLYGTYKTGKVDLEKLHSWPVPYMTHFIPTLPRKDPTLRTAAKYSVATDFFIKSNDPNHMRYKRIRFPQTIEQLKSRHLPKNQGGRLIRYIAPHIHTPHGQEVYTMRNTGLLFYTQITQTLEPYVIKNHPSDNGATPIRHEIEEQELYSRIELEVNPDNSPLTLEQLAGNLSNDFWTGDSRPFKRTIEVHVIRTEQDTTQLNFSYSRLHNGIEVDKVQIFTQHLETQIWKPILKNFKKRIGGTRTPWKSPTSFFTWVQKNVPKLYFVSIHGTTLTVKPIERNLFSSAKKGETIMDFTPSGFVHIHYEFDYMNKVFSDHSDYEGKRNLTSFRTHYFSPYAPNPINMSNQVDDFTERSYTHPYLLQRIAKDWPIAHEDAIFLFNKINLEHEWREVDATEDL